MSDVAEAAERPVQARPRPSLEGWMKQQVGRLWAAYRDDVPWGVRQMALLRRVDLADLDSATEVWNLLSDLPDRGVTWRDDQALTRMEWSALASLVLYAHHQQSKRQRSMHRRHARVGAAIGGLVPDKTQPGTVGTRFRALMDCDERDAVFQHLRGLVSRLRSDERPLDYVALAADLHRLQDPRSAPAVRLRWARDFYTYTPNPDEVPASPTSEKETSQP